MAKKMIEDEVPYQMSVEDWEALRKVREAEGWKFEYKVKTYPADFSKVTLDPIGWRVGWSRDEPEAKA
jgi:hypothetical protein